MWYNEFCCCDNDDINPEEHFTKIFLKHDDLIRVGEIMPQDEKEMKQNKKEILHVKIKELQVELYWEEEKDKDTDSEDDDNSTKNDDAIVVKVSQIEEENENFTQDNDDAVPEAVMVETSQNKHKNEEKCCKEKTKKKHQDAKKATVRKAVTKNTALKENKIQLSRSTILSGIKAENILENIVDVNKPPRKKQKVTYNKKRECMHNAKCLECKYLLMPDT
eukprot:15367169-Ditylum_brightwellii.AAC.3